jgi:hypothetical protein
MELGIIKLSKISQAQKDKYTWSHSSVESKKVDFIEVESRMMVTRGEREAREGSWSVSTREQLDQSQ